MTDVLIVGAGPAGLLLASELRLAGVDTVVIERHPERPGFCRGFNLNARALDLLARRGLADRLIGEGWQVPHAAFGGLLVTLSLPGTHTDHPYSLGIPQTRVEEVLEAHALDLGADLRRGHELLALRQDADSVTATVATSGGEYQIRAAYLAGDAAHIHPPAGAIGVNVALDDAFNLGWKLAATVLGTAPAGLLGTYHAERHPAGARVLANTRAQALLAEAGDRLAPLTDLLTRVATHPAGNRGFAETVTGLDTRYDMVPDTAHPWLGRLAPNLALSTGADDTDLAALLVPGRGVLLDLAADDDLRNSAEGWADRVEIVTATCPRYPEFRAILLRPDGHTAWLSTAADDRTAGLHQALRRWYGPAMRSRTASPAASAADRGAAGTVGNARAGGVP